MSQYIINPFFTFGNPPTETENAWIEIGRTPQTFPTDLLSVTIPKKRFLMVLVALEGSGVGDDVEIQFNGDVSANYGNTISIDGGLDSGLFTTAITDTFGVGGTNLGFYILWIDNNPTGEKLVHKQFVSRNASGAGTPPRRVEQVSKWANQTDQITSIQFRNTGPGDYTFGEAVILGWDPTDAQSPINNFWQPLTSNELLVDSDKVTLDFHLMKKKYLWARFVILANVTTPDPQPYLRLGDVTEDLGFNIAQRSSTNGNPDLIAGGLNTIVTGGNHIDSERHQTELFIVNFTNKEKLIIMHSEGFQDGASSIPDRRQIVAKWVNLVAQDGILSMDDLNGTVGAFTRGSYGKVWGHD